jgi:hypothetical protein
MSFAFRAWRLAGTPPATHEAVAGIFEEFLAAWAQAARNPLVVAAAVHPDHGFDR